MRLPSDPMHVRVLLASANGFVAAEPVLAELDAARRELAPSGVRLSAMLLGAPGASVPDPVEVAARLGFDLEVRSTLEAGTVAALLDGLRAALDQRADVIVSLDGDGQHDARQIPDLVRVHLARGSGLTIGSRWVRGGSSPGNGMTRTMLSRLGNQAVKSATGARGVSDSTTSFRVYEPEVVETLLNEPLPDELHGCFSAMVALVQARGFGVDEVPIVFRPRYVGAGKLAGDDLRGFAQSLLPVRRRVHAVRREMRSNQAIWAQRNPRLRAQAATGESKFAAIGELTNLSDADRFIRWISDELRPHLGQRVLEVGAGLGAISFTLARAGHDVVALEPADNVFPELARRATDTDGIDVLRLTSQELLASEHPNDFDSVVYVSVLEHILDDVAELRTAFELVRPGGTLGIFVPAMPSLYGSLDFQSGHYRRYDRDLLRHVIEEAGFELVDLYYLDVAGVVPYFIMYRLLDLPRLDAGSSAVYDRAIVPVGRLIQRFVAQPAFGKNLLAVARRPLGTNPPACQPLRSRPRTPPRTDHR